MDKLRLNGGMSPSAFTRRAVLLSVAAGLVAAYCKPTLSFAEDPVGKDGTTPELPDPGTFQSGDLIWPKKPGQVVPYTAEYTSTYEKDKKRWEGERKKFLAAIKKKKNAPPHERKAAQVLETMTFEEFLSMYLGNSGSTGLRPESIDFPVYWGHVGMIFIKDGTPWVVEAVIPKVRQVPYSTFLSDRAGANVWHGRLMKFSLSDRAKVPQEALKQDGKPFEFFNLDLSDGSGFYCSKLVWLSVFRTLGIALDDDPDPKRWFWFSPKQALNSGHVELLFKPGEYFQLNRVPLKP